MSTRTRWDSKQDIPPRPSPRDMGVCEKKTNKKKSENIFTSTKYYFVRNSVKYAISDQTLQYIFSVSQQYQMTLST